MSEQTEEVKASIKNEVKEENSSDTNVKEAKNEKSNNRRRTGGRSSNSNDRNDRNDRRSRSGGPNRKRNFKNGNSNDQQKVPAPADDEILILDDEDIDLSDISLTPEEKAALNSKDLKSKNKNKR